MKFGEKVERTPLSKVVVGKGMVAGDEPETEEEETEEEPGGEKRAAFDLFADALKRGNKEHAMEALEAFIEHCSAEKEY